MHDPKTAARLHDEAAEAHDRAANAAAESRKYTDENRHTQGHDAGVATDAEVQLSNLAQAATERVVELTRTAPTGHDTQAAIEAEYAFDQPQTSDRHLYEAEQASRKAALAHRRAAEFYREGPGFEPIQFDREAWEKASDYARDYPGVTDEPTLTAIRNSHYAWLVGEKTREQADEGDTARLLRDFARWSGGFHPSEAEDQIDAYVEAANNTGLPSERVRELLRKEVDDANAAIGQMAEPIDPIAPLGMALLRDYADSGLSIDAYIEGGSFARISDAGRKRLRELLSRAPAVPTSDVPCAENPTHPDYPSGPGTTAFLFEDEKQRNEIARWQAAEAKDDPQQGLWEAEVVALEAAPIYGNHASDAPTLNRAHDVLMSEAEMPLKIRALKRIDETMGSKDTADEAAVLAYMRECEEDGTSVVVADEAAISRHPEALDAGELREQVAQSLLAIARLVHPEDPGAVLAQIALDVQIDAAHSLYKGTVPLERPLPFVWITTETDGADLVWAESEEAAESLCRTKLAVSFTDRPDLLPEGDDPIGQLWERYGHEVRPLQGATDRLTPPEQELDLSPEEREAAHNYVVGLCDMNSASGWLDLLLHVAGPDWMRGAVKEAAELEQNEEGAE